jgi:acetyl-CoA synthetase
VRCDPDGTSYILDRSDDRLNIVGKSIGPPQVEAALTGTGKVMDAAAIAAPDGFKVMAVVCVYVAPRGMSPNGALIDQLKDRMGKVVSKPFRRREIHSVDAPPKIPSMKTMLRIVRAAFLNDRPGDMSSINNPKTIQPNAELRKDKP